jgi:hypothetical protein
MIVSLCNEVLRELDFAAQCALEGPQLRRPGDRAVHIVRCTRPAACRAARRIAPDHAGAWHRDHRAALPAAGARRSLNH